MIAVDESALICDLAETYGIFDYNMLPVKTVAILSAGLRGNSRIKMKMRGAQTPGDSSFWLSMTIDRITDVLGWFGAYEKNPRPVSATDLYLGDIAKANTNTNNIKAFGSADEFNKAREKILR